MVTAAPTPAADDEPDVPATGDLSDASLTGGTGDEASFAAGTSASAVTHSTGSGPTSYSWTPPAIGGAVPHPMLPGGPGPDSGLLPAAGGPVSTWRPTPTPVGPLVGGAVPMSPMVGPQQVPVRIAEARVADAAERMLAVVVALAPPGRGKAVDMLTRFLVRTHRCPDLVCAAELATDLLEVEETSTLEMLAVLLADGWEGTLGELLACARAV